MDSPEITPEARRLQWVGRWAILWVLIVFARLIHLQVIQSGDLRRLADGQQERESELRPRRGAILDRNEGKLADSEPTISLAINPRKLGEPAVAAGLLARVLRLKESELRANIQRAHERRRGFLWVKRDLTQPEQDSLRQFHTDWMDLREESRRVYPKGELGAPILGGVNHAQHGNAGVELALDKDLRGKPGFVRMLTDVHSRELDELEMTPPEPGKTIALTIDERLQSFCDRILHREIREGRCRSGTIVVMNPHTGEVLAMSSAPGFDANVPPPKGPLSLDRSNRAIAAPSEPGSVFKMFSIALALESSELRPSSPVDCGGGVYRCGKWTINDVHRMGRAALEEVLWHSSNVGAIQISQHTGSRRLYQGLRSLGFGSATGIGLPGESGGVLARLDNWDSTAMCSLPIGYGLSATTLQLARATSAIANGGWLVRPRVVLWKQVPGEERIMEPEGPRARVLRPEVAVDMRTMSEGVILKGTGKLARLVEHTTGGKTGTARAVENGQYLRGIYNSTFIGYAPLNRPSLVAVVTLNGATKFGGAVAAPVYREVMLAALRLFSIERDLTLPGPEETIEEVRPEQKLVAEAPPVITEEAPGELLTGPRVPQLVGRTKIEVLQLAAETGMGVDLVGQGLARAQFPAPGSVLPSGKKIRVQFSR